jgi:hypothetical protein
MVTGYSIIGNHVFSFPAKGLNFEVFFFHRMIIFACLNLYA